MNISIRDVKSEELEYLHEVNQANTPHLGSISFECMQHLYNEAACFKVAEADNTLAGFIIAFTPDADYDSPNFLYFKREYEHFLYIDRIVVLAEYRRKCVGTAFYDAMAAYVKEQQLGIVTCEYNLRPPNEISRMFHANYGFQEVGRQETEEGKCTVSLQVKYIKK